ncbi:MAG: methyltransferase domain-containing protein [Candidatus Cloacimonadota bacterium]|nr:methyltransferase domain-containing protein [Candidatus Cloacimonadota bacterium]
MNIDKLLKFLKDKNNRNFFKELQELKEITINDIQQLISNNPDKPIKEMLSQIKIQKKNLSKMPISNELLFTEQGAQQASSWKLAKYHATKFKAFIKVADLCCGIGVDLINIAKGKEQIYAIDLDADILKIAKYNCKSQNLNNIKFISGKAEEFNQRVDAIFIDPDRRPGSNRRIAPEEYSPPFSEIMELRNICPNIAVKLSPAIDYKRLNLPIDSTLEFVSENGTLKEILLCMGKLSTENCERKAVLLPTNLTLQNSNVKSKITEIQKYLFEPDPAIIRAGLVQELGSKIGYNLIDSKLALLTGSQIVQSDFGKIYEVKTIMKFDLKKVRKYVRKNEIGELIIKTRGFPESVEKFRKKIKLKGNNSVVMFILRKGDDHIFVFTQIVKQT